MDYIYHSKPTIDKEDLKITLECMVSDYVGPGNLVLEFEKEISAIFSKKYAVATYSGSVSLFLILKTLGLKEGDSLILPAYAPSYIINPLLYLSVNPILVDVNEDYSLNLDDIDRKINESVKAILLVPLFGIPIDDKIYRRYNIPIIYNATQVLGSYYDNNPPGYNSDFIFLSFYATKMITTGGLGGCILTDNKEYYNKIKNLILREPDKNVPTYPFLMSDLQASMGLSQLKRLGEFVEIRNRIAKFYTENLKSKNIFTPPCFLNRRVSFFRYVIKMNDVDKVIKIAKEHNIEVKRPIEKPLYLFLDKTPEKYPTSHFSYIQNLSIPIYPTLNNNQVKRIVKVINSIL